MSSDYGSDISEEAFDAVVHLPTTPTRARPSSERAPLADLSANAIRTPPASQSHTVSDLLPPSSSQLKFQTPGQPHGVQQCATPSTAPKSSQALDAPKGLYKFNFGEKHFGKTVDEVDEIDKPYFDFLERKGILARRPDLKAALDDLARRKALIEELERQRAAAEALQRERARIEESARQKAAKEALERRKAEMLKSLRQEAAAENLRREKAKNEELERRKTAAEALERQKAALLQDATPYGLPISSSQSTHRTLPTPLSRDAAVPQMSQLVAIPPPPVPQPALPNQHIGLEPPLYRFPWGAHQGKTLLEVPEIYFTHLKMQRNIDHMAGLKEALALFEQGKRPIDTRHVQEHPKYPVDSFPTSISSQPIAARNSPVSTLSYPPSSSAPSPFLTTPANSGGASQTNPLPSMGPPASITPSADPAEYRLDFGENKGKKLSEVPESYITFLKKHKVMDRRPALAEAMAYFDRVHPPEQRYRLTFGSHEGESLFEVGANYINWLKKNDVASSYPDLAAAMSYFEKATAKKRKPAKKQKKRSAPSSSRPSKRPRSMRLH